MSDEQRRQPPGPPPRGLCAVGWRRDAPPGSCAANYVAGTLLFVNRNLGAAPGFLKRERDRSLGGLAIQTGDSAVRSDRWKPAPQLLLEPRHRAENPTRQDEPARLGEQ